MVVMNEFSNLLFYKIGEKSVKHVIIFWLITSFSCLMLRLINFWLLRQLQCRYPLKIRYKNMNLLFT